MPNHIASSIPQVCMHVYISHHEENIKRFTHARTHTHRQIFIIMILANCWINHHLNGRKLNFLHLSKSKSDSVETPKSLFECCALCAGVVFASAPGHSCLWCQHLIQIAEHLDAVCAHSTLESCYLWVLKVGTPKCIKFSKHSTFQYCSLQAAEMLCTSVRPTR